MKIFERNMECIKKHRSFLYNSITKLNVQEIESFDNIYSVETKTDQKALIIKQNSVEYKLNSIYNPIEEANRWVKQYNFNNIGNLISMFGLGNGVFARSILQHMKSNDTLIIYEPSSSLFFYVLENYDLTDLLSRKDIKLAIKGINDFEFHNSLNLAMNINNIRYQIMCTHPKYDNIFPESCIRFWKEIKEAYIHTKMNINTEIIFGKRFINNIILNMKYIKGSNTINEIIEYIPKNIPAIVVAAGPSVAKNINVLKKAKGKALIVAVDRILDFLLDNGLEPDFVATIDPRKPIEYFSRRNDVTIPLLCFLGSNNEILDIHKGKKIICNSSSYVADLYKENDKIAPGMFTGSSVATTAFTACLVMGFKTIILVGQDLAYDGELSHAGGIGETDTSRDVMVDDINGQLIRSRIDWKEFIRWYQDMIVLFPDVNVIDAKEKGALIKGATTMSLEDALEKYCKDYENFCLDINGIQPTFDDSSIYKYIMDYINNSILELNDIEVKAKEAIKLCDYLIDKTQKNINSIKINIKLEKLNNIVRQIEKINVYKLMDYYISATNAQNISEMYEFTNDIYRDSIQTYRKAKHTFVSILEGKEYILKLMEKLLLDLNNS